MSLTVVTQISDLPSEYSNLTVSSVNSQLPKGAESLTSIARTSKEWVDSLWEYLETSEHVCFLGEQGFVVNHGLQKCYEAALSLDVGLAFTAEDHVDAVGNPLGELPIKPATSLTDLLEHPRKIPALSIIRSSAIPSRARQNFEEAGCHPMFLGWYVRALAAITQGAVGLEMVGHHWRIPSTCSGGDLSIAEYGRELLVVRNLLMKSLENDRPLMILTSMEVEPFLPTQQTESPRAEKEPSKNRKNGFVQLPTKVSNSNSNPPEKETGLLTEETAHDISHL